MKERILILEDDVDMREALMETLEDEDYEVYGVSSGNEALKVARQVQPHLVVADVRMEGMDGIECLARLRELCPESRSIVITGYASQDAPVRAIKAQAEDYLYKPFSLDDFVAAVERVLSAAEEQDRYSSMLGGVFTGYKKLVQAAGTVIARVELASLEKAREQAFNGFYVGVRSGQLTHSEALHVWDRLEVLEKEREVLKSAGLHVKERQDLADGYKLLVDTITALSRQDYVFHSQRKPEQVTVPAFREFYGRLKSGTITAQQLRLAPFLRTLDGMAIEQSEELKSLHETVWGDAA